MAKEREAQYTDREIRIFRAGCETDFRLRAYNPTDEAISCAMRAAGIKPGQREAVTTLTWEDRERLVPKIAEILRNAWRKYVNAFGEAPHGTDRQLAALLEFAWNELSASAILVATTADGTMKRVED